MAQKPGVRKYAPEVVQDILDMMDRGATAREAGAAYGIGRNAVLGLRFRAGRSNPEPAPAMAGEGQAPAKPCLRCGGTSPRDPAHRICDACKSSDVFRGIAGAY
jgi:hypothetical protein